MKDLALHLADLLQNATRAHASRIEVSLEHDTAAASLHLIVKDNGCGMNADTLVRATDPFFSTKAGHPAGLGLPLLKQNAEMTGGDFLIHSQPDNGTTVAARFKLRHIDCRPVGDIAGTMALAIASHPDTHFIFHYTQTPTRDFRFDTDDLYHTLENVSVQNPQVIGWIKEMIEENIKDN